MKTFKSLSLILFVFTLFAYSFQLRAQDSEKSFMVYPTFGVGIGFFYPKDVNTYIEEYMFQEALESYNTEIYMYLEVKGGVTFRLKNVDFGVIMEYDIAPKFVVVSGGGGEDDTYAFSRYSPELSANYYIPGKSGKNAFFIGAGINYSFMEFEGIKASAPGVKFQLGYSMQFGKFNMQPYGAFRYVKGTDDDAIWGMGNEKFELNYTGGQIGIILSFHQRMLYR